MLKTLILCCAALVAHGQSIKPDYKELTFSKEISDWFIFDIDGDDRREVLVFHPSEEDGRPFTLCHRMDDVWQQKSGKIPNTTVALAMGSFGFGVGSQIALIHSEEVTFLKLNESFDLVPCGPKIEFTNLIRSPLAGAPNFWHWATDIDGDGHDDLYLPGDDGILVHFSTGQGSFTEARTLRFDGTRGVMQDSTGHLDYLRSYPRPIFKDLDADGRLDLVWFDSDGLFAHLQKKARSFDSENPVTFTLPWLSGADSEGIVEQTEVNLEDLNGDGRPDLFLSRMSTPASGLSDLRTTLVVLINREGEFFSRSPDFALRVQGVIGNGPSFVDMNNDGLKDLVFGSYGASMSAALQRFMGSVKISFHIHRGLKDSKTPFETQPTRLFDMEMDKDDFEEWGARNSFNVGEDLNGDGLGDLFTLERQAKGRHRLKIAEGKESSKSIVFASETSLEFDAEDLESISFRTMEPKRGIATILIKKSSIGILQFPN